jgi:heat shock protein HslJ
MRTSWKNLAALAACGALLLAGCQAMKPESSTASSGEELVDRTWIIEDLDRGGIIDRSRVTVQFSAEDGRVAGAASCNRYSAGYTLGSEGLSIMPIAATKMACAPALMHQEQKFLRILGAVDAFEIDAVGALVLSGPEGTMRGFAETP